MIEGSTTVPHAAQHIQEFRGPGVTIIMGYGITPPQLLGPTTARNDVIERTSASGALQACSHARGSDRIQKAGLEGDHETKRPRLPGQE